MIIIYCFYIVFCSIFYAQEDVIEKRLSTHVYALSAYNKKIACSYLVINDICFRHNLVKWIAKKIIEENSLMPLVAAWDTFLRCENFQGERGDVYDKVFIVDFSRMIFLIYQAQLRNATRVSMHDIMQLYFQISQLPVAQLLDLLDECLSQFKIIMSPFTILPNEYLYDWFIQYWWIPPVILASVGISVIRWYIGMPHML